MAHATVVSVEPAPPPDAARAPAANADAPRTSDTACAPAAQAAAAPLNSEDGAAPCCVCLVARRDHAFQPCGHLCVPIRRPHFEVSWVADGVKRHAIDAMLFTQVCGPCGDMLSRRADALCPICRQRVRSTQRIFT